jgi:glycosyltransferase involved in cell wall biosynthesis
MTSALTIAQMIESDEPGGAELVLVRLAAELRRRGHTVIPVGPAKGVGWLGERLREAGFEPRTFTLRRPVDWRCVRDHARMLRELRVDVIHSHEFTMSVYGTAASLLLQRPHVITMHGNETMTKVLRRRIALRWAFRNSHASVGCSRSTTETLEKDLGLRRGEIGVVLNGVPVPHGSPDSVRREIGCTEGEFLLFAAGTLVPRKGHMVLLQALRRLSEMGCVVPWRLAIAGWRIGEEPARLDAFIAEHALGSKVHLLGQRNDIANWLAAADVFVMPSLWEGLPLAILEAMLARKAIVATATSGIPEAIVNDEHGLLVPPGDAEALAAALRRVLEDSSLRARLASAAFARAEREFTIEAMTDRYEHLYRQ